MHLAGYIFESQNPAGLGEARHSLSGKQKITDDCRGSEGHLACPRGRKFD